MDTALLEDFLALARAMNFSRAAETRNMTQPAFSRRIRSLEDALGTPLVNRTTRQIALTPAGRAFQPRAEAIVRMLADARHAALEAAGRTERSLTLAATHALSYTFVPRWLTRVAGPSEVGTLNMVSDSHRQCLRLMQDGEASFFICHRGMTSAPALPEKQFRAHPVGADRLVPLCVPDADGQPRWRLDRAGPEAPFLAYGSASGLHAILETHWAARGCPKLRRAMQSMLAATNLEMAKEGQGVAYLPLSLAEDELALGRLVRAAGDAHDIPVEVVIHRPRARLTSHCERFWDTVTGN